MFASVSHAQTDFSGLGNSWASPGTSRDNRSLDSDRSSLSDDNGGQFVRTDTFFRSLPTQNVVTNRGTVVYRRSGTTVVTQPAAPATTLQASAAPVIPQPITGAPITIPQQPVTPVPAPVVQQPVPTTPVIPVTPQVAAPYNPPTPAPIATTTYAPLPTTTPVAPSPAAPVEISEPTFVPYTPPVITHSRPAPQPIAPPAPVAPPAAPSTTETTVTFSTALTAERPPTHANMPPAPAKYQPFEPALSGYILPPRSNVRIATRLPLATQPEYEGIQFADAREFQHNPLTTNAITLPPSPKFLTPNGDNEGKRKFTRQAFIPVGNTSASSNNVRLDTPTNETGRVHAGEIPPTKDEEINTLTPFIEWIKHDPQAADVARRSTQEAHAAGTRPTVAPDIGLQIYNNTPVTEERPPDGGAAIYVSPKAPGMP